MPARSSAGRGCSRPTGGSSTSAPSSRPARSGSTGSACAGSARPTTSSAISSCAASPPWRSSGSRPRGFSSSTSMPALSPPEPAAAGPMVPAAYRVAGTRQDTSDTWTLELAPCDGDGFPFAPGQFTMLAAGGTGEVPISISGDPARTETLVHTVRAVGPATRAICAARPGDVLSVRGPFGRPWPVDDVEGADVVVATGGIGLAPLRPAILRLLDRAERYGRL